ncbi:MAG: hypothetical protein F2789_16855 [Actinobacteria bacterium]|nr:hypothetical protein [Actinomycetota bacterium]
MTSADRVTHRRAGPERTTDRPGTRRRIPDTTPETSAKAICAACPVVAECLMHALDHRETRGI